MTLNNDIKHTKAGDLMTELTYVEQLQADYTRLRTATRAGTITQADLLAAIDEATSNYAVAHAESYEVARSSGRSQPINYKNDRMLDAFTDLALHADLTWSHADKMSIIEYPIMSERQSDRRAANTSMPGDITYNDRQGAGKRSAYFTDGNDTPRTSKARMTSHDDTLIKSSIINIDLLRAIEDADLSERQAQVIELVYGEGLTQEAAAKELGIRQHTVSEYISAAIAKIRAKMTNEYDTLRV